MLKSLKRLVDSALYSLIPLALTLLTAAILSNSLAVLSMTADYGLSLVVHLFSHQSIRANQMSSSFPMAPGSQRISPPFCTAR